MWVKKGELVVIFFFFSKYDVFCCVVLCCVVLCCVVLCCVVDGLYNTFSISFVFTMANTSSIYRFQKLMSLLALTVFFSRSCNTASARKLESGEPIGVPVICL